MLCDDSVIRPVSQLRHGSRRAADLLPSPFCVFVGMARNRQPKVTRWALAANVFILLLSGATAVFSITQLAGVVDAMGSSPAVHSVVMRPPFHVVVAVCGRNEPCHTIKWRSCGVCAGCRLPGGPGSRRDGWWPRDRRGTPHRRVCLSRRPLRVEAPSRRPVRGFLHDHTRRRWRVVTSWLLDGACSTVGGQASLGVATLVWRSNRVCARASGISTPHALVFVFT